MFSNIKEDLKITFYTIALLGGVLMLASSPTLLNKALDNLDARDSETLNKLHKA